MSITDSYSDTGRSVEAAPGAIWMNNEHKLNTLIINICLKEERRLVDVTDLLVNSDLLHPWAVTGAVPTKEVHVREHLGDITWTLLFLSSHTIICRSSPPHYKIISNRNFPSLSLDYQFYKQMVIQPWQQCFGKEKTLFSHSCDSEPASDAIPAFPPV